MTETIEQTCRRIVLAERPAAPPMIDPETLTATTELVELGFDGLDVVSVIVGIEEALGVDLHPTADEEIYTFGALVAAFEAARARVDAR